MASSLTTGQVLGPYELLRPLGRGGSGEVWEATLRGPGGFRKPVALKMLREVLLADPMQREMLLREARLGARLQHPNIVGTLLVGEHEGRLCVALELVRGQSAEALHRSVGPLPGRALLDLGEQAARALHHIHTFRHNGRAAGLIHRDVKPANLLVDQMGVVKLADLGISLAQGQQTGMVAGTYGFMPAEQLFDDAEPRSDLFALGATLYLLATGQRPFGTGQAAGRAVCQADKWLARPGFLTAVEAAAPGLGDVVRACLAQLPEGRPEDALAVARALAALRARAPSGPSLRDLCTGGAVAAPSEASVGSSGASAPTMVLPGGNLRPVRDRFVGRDDELRMLAERAVTGSWVVLLGPGGMGKTRLALELCRQQQADLPGGAWAFDLAEARSPSGLCAAIAGALGVPLGARDPVVQVGRLLAGKGRCLVVLDNLEQCVEALPETVGRWRTMAPEACFVGTSRIRPGLAGEEVVSIGVLAAPAAVELFAERAQRSLAPAETQEVVELCAALEYMPLPIELAAARVGLLSVAAIRERLSLGLLSGGGRDRPARQRSVQASLRWSWELLQPPAQHALGQLSAFEGPFSLGAAEAVLDLGVDAPWALDVLQELVDASLLRVDPDTLRFAMWVVVREFAAELLTPSERRAAERRHGEHFAQLGLAPHDLDLDNLVAASRRAAERGDGDVAVATLEGASSVFDRRGPASAWYALAQQVARLRLPPAAGCRAQLALAQACIESGHTDEAEAPLQRGLREASRAGDVRTEAYLRSLLGELVRRTGHESDAHAHLRAARELHRSAGDEAGEAMTLGRLGRLHAESQRPDEARRCLAAALRQARSEGDLRLVAQWELVSGVIEARAHEIEACQAAFRRALTTGREAGDLRTMAVAQGNLATARMSKGELEQAAELLSEAVRMHRSLGDPWHEDLFLGNLSVVLREQGQLDAARARIYEALALATSIDDQGNLGFLHLVAAQLASVQGQVDTAWRHLRACLANHERTGHHRFTADAQRVAARLHRVQGDLAAARQALRQAAEAAEVAGADSPSRANVHVAQAQLAVYADAPSDEAVREAVEHLDAARGRLKVPSVDHCRFWAVAAVVHHHLGDTEAAHDALARARHLDLRSPYVEEALAWARQRLGGL